jgi:hypothetical protein
MDSDVVVCRGREVFLVFPLARLRLCWILVFILQAVVLAVRRSSVARLVAKAISVEFFVGVVLPDGGSLILRRWLKVAVLLAVAAAVLLPTLLGSVVVVAGGKVVGIATRVVVLQVLRPRSRRLGEVSVVGDGNAAPRGTLA